MDLDDVSRSVAALDGVRESRVKRRLRWSVRGRLVARQLDDESIVIRSGFADRERLLAAHPTTFSVPPRFEGHMMIVARLPRADAAAVTSALRDAWELQRR